MRMQAIKLCILYQSIWLYSYTNVPLLKTVSGPSRYYIQKLISLLGKISIQSILLAHTYTRSKQNRQRLENIQHAISVSNQIVHVKNFVSFSMKCAEILMFHEFGVIPRLQEYEDINHSQRKN